jgi:PAS domain S-box-containing protein
MTETNDRSAIPHFELVDRVESYPQCQPIHQALLESQARMALAIEAARMGTYDLDLITLVATWNEYQARLLDYPYPPDAAGYSYADWERRVHPVDLPKVTAALQHARETQTDYNIEYRVVWRDGSVHWLHNVGRFYYDADGRALRSIGVASDITERQVALQERERSELQIAQNEERMSLAFDAAQMGSFDWDIPRDEIVWNVYHSRLLGYSTGAGVYNYADWERVVHPDDLARVLAAVEVAKLDRTDYSAIYRVVWADGTVRWLEGFGRFQYDTNERPIRMTGVIFDVTERQTALLETQQTALALRESERRYRALVEATAKITWNTTADGKFRGVQSSWAAYTGQSYPEYSNSGWMAAIHPTERAQTERAWAAAVCNLTLFEVEHRLRRFDGVYRDMSVRAVPILRSNGSVQEWVGVHTDITERKQAERRYRAPIEATAQVVWTLSPDGHFVTEQPSWSAFTGQSFAEYCEWGWLAAIHPAERTQITDVWSNTNADATIFEVEQRLRRYDGEYREMSVRGVPIVDDDGSVREWVGVHTDITERKRAERTLQQSEQRYRALIDATAQIVWSTAADGHFVTEQPSWSAFTGQSFAEYRGWGWSAAFHPNDRARIDRLWLKSLADLTTFEMEQRLRRADGQYRHMSVRAVPILTADGSVREWVGVHADITDRIHAELALKESEARFRSTFEQAGMGIAHVGLSGRWLFVNSTICEITGYTEAELLGMNFQDLTHPDDLPQDRENIRQILAGEIQIVKFEKRYIHKLGHITWINLTGTLRRSEAGEPLYFIASFEDINDRKQAEFALQAQALELAKTTTKLELRNQELSRFSYVVSHDLKAPLRAIANLSEWIEEDLAEVVDPSTKKNLDLMRSRVHRMEALIDGLLEYARVGNTQVSLETFSIEHLLTEIIDSIGIPSSFTIELPTALPPITTNRTLLYQVLANLIGNAYKHHPRPDGRIRLSVAPTPEAWEFTVTDDGKGIAPTDRDRVFGIFQTLADPDKKNTGIGLSIVKKIVEERGGTISLESQLGQGCTFKFRWVE